LHFILWGGLAYGAGWWFLFDFSQVPTLVGMGVPILIGGYKLIAIFGRWYANGILMTTECIRFVDWKKMFDVQMTRLDYWDQDQIIIQRVGAMPYILSYGDLVFMKISGGAPIEYKNINRPRKVMRVLTKNREVTLDEKNFMEEGALKNLISQMVQTQTRHGGQPGERKNFSESGSEAVAPQFDAKPEKRIRKKKKSRFEEMSVEIEKKLDDTGGIEIDLD